MKIVQHNQGSPTWLAWRREGIGGSDVAAIVGCSPYEDHTREVVFREKTTGFDRERNFEMRRGQRLEPHARFAYEQHARCTAPPVCVEMTCMPWARVSLDGLCTNGAVIDRVQWILELKCPSWEVHDSALAGVVAKHFDVQIQWQLLVTGLERCDFASFNPGERFTPRDWSLRPAWEARYDAWLARPKCDRGARPELLDVWLELPPAKRPPMPPEWLAVEPIAADHAKQSWIMEEAAKFWFEVLEAREAAAKVKAVESLPGDVEAEFA